MKARSLPEYWAMIESGISPRQALLGYDDGADREAQKGMKAMSMPDDQNATVDTRLDYI